MLSAWLVRLLYGDLSAVLSSQLPWRYELAAGVSALGLLAYYRLWMRALSPRITEARLAALQARIRPHFFFNSLNAVLSLIRSDPRRAETMLENLSDLFRVAMGRKQGLSTLAREVELARGYLDIEKVRLGERLQIEWFIDRMPAKAAIPPLILQPLLENAVYHGIEPSLFPGVVQVNLFRVRDEVHIDIRNPLPKAGDDRARRIGNGDLRQHLSVQVHAGLLQTVHKGGVIHTVCLAGSRDTGNPHSTEISLLLLTADVSVLAALHHSLLSSLKQTVLAAVITLCSL
jgi:two-component system sensor histidine kinase AlgZ